MSNAIYAMPDPMNEPVLGFLPRSPERTALSEAVKAHAADEVEIPLIIGGEEVRTGNTVKAIVPHDHGHVLATVHMAGPAEVARAIDAAEKAKLDWVRQRYVSRAAIFHKCAALLAGPWRMDVNAATMLNQSKTCHQAEIDAACELIDFFRFNCKYMEEIYQ